MAKVTQPFCLTHLVLKSPLVDRQLRVSKRECLDESSTETLSNGQRAPHFSSGRSVIFCGHNKLSFFDKKRGRLEVGRRGEAYGEGAQLEGDSLQLALQNGIVAKL